MSDAPKITTARELPPDGIVGSTVTCASKWGPGSMTYVVESYRHNPYTQTYDYHLIAQGFSTNGANKGTRVRARAWAQRADLFALENESSGGSYDNSIRIEDGRFVDLLPRMTDSMVVPFEMHGMTYYRRTPILLDGQPIEGTS